MARYTPDMSNARRCPYISDATLQALATNPTLAAQAYPHLNREARRKLEKLTRLARKATKSKARGKR